MPIVRDEKKRKEIIEMLTKAYWMEIETVMSYIANSVNLDGVRAEEIKKSLAADITDEVGHAQEFAKRVKTVYGKVPGSMEFKPEQSYPQPPDHRGPRRPPVATRAEDLWNVEAEVGELCSQPLPSSPRPLGAPLPLAQALKRGAQVVLGHGPVLGI